MQLALTTRRGSDEVRWDWAASSPTPLIHLRENDSCSLQLKALAAEQPFGSGESLRLLLSGSSIEPRACRADGTGVTIHWTWSIDFYAGQLDIEILNGPKSVWRGLLDVHPHDGKLAKAAYDTLLADLQRRATNVLFGTTAALQPVAKSDVLAPAMARLAMMRTHLATLELAFDSIAARPNRRLVAQRQTVPLDRARRIDVAGMRSLIRNLPALAALGYAEAVETPKRPSIDHPRREHTFLTRPNQHIAALLHRLVCACRDLQAEFNRIAAAEDDPQVEERASGFSRETKSLQLRLARMRRAQFLDDVPPLEGDVAAMIAVAKDPTYARFDGVARRMLLPRLEPGQSANERVWLRRTFELYEYWCFFRLADAVREACGEGSFRSNLRLERGELLVNLPDGCYVEVASAGILARLTFQHAFRAYSPALDDGSEPYSISGARRPDTVLTLRSDDRVAMVVFDAKYRCGRDPIHEALRDMHVYRDCLRVAGAATKLLGAYILTPAHDAGAEAYFLDAYVTRHCIGGFDLSPGDQKSDARLVKAVRRLLSDFGRGPTA